MENDSTITSNDREKNNKFSQKGKYPSKERLAIGGGVGRPSDVPVGFSNGGRRQFQKE